MCMLTIMDAKFIVDLAPDIAYSLMVQVQVKPSKYEVKMFRNLFNQVMVMEEDSTAELNN